MTRKFSHQNMFCIIKKIETKYENLHNFGKIDTLIFILKILQTQGKQKNYSIGLYKYKFLGDNLRTKIKKKKQLNTSSYLHDNSHVFNSVMLAPF